MPDGSSYSAAVDYPCKEDGTPEELLTFDVETLPKYHPYAVMACAASPTAWYAWISPWLLEGSPEPNQLIPLGPDVERVIVGHNVSYDRGRVKEEYNVYGTQNRWLDTMALHVAVQGISSHQRPAWMKWRKRRDTDKERLEEARVALEGMLQLVEGQMAQESDPEKLTQMEKTRTMICEGLSTSNIPLVDSVNEVVSEDDSDAEAAQSWESLTSVNSLAEVASLHGITLNSPKSTRDDFMKLPPADILTGLPEYLTYCASDVQATHSVFAKVLPSFLTRCPHPVSFAGILRMGSSFLCVDEGWEKYLEQAEGVYKSLEKGVRRKLCELAEAAMSMVRDVEVDGEKGAEKWKDEKWKDDVWLSQLDWTPKVAGKSRGIFPPCDPEVVSRSVSRGIYSFALQVLSPVEESVGYYSSRNCSTLITELSSPKNRHPSNFPTGTSKFRLIP